MATTLVVNGCEHTVEADPAKPLLWVLREDLGIVGPKYGCGLGVCRSCAVLLDGEVVQSCLYPLSVAEGKAVTTIEGLTDDLAMTVQEAWVSVNVSQCGYCQPGQIVSAYALLTKHPKPTDADIDRGMPNLCRCGTYQRIRQAIKDAAEEVP